MKDKILDLIEYLAFLILGIAIGLNIYNPCDVNRDGIVSSQDYVIVKNYIMKGCDNNG